MKKLFIVLISGILLSCNTKKETQEEEKTESYPDDTSKSSLDWAGEYEGILPCADCEGIKSVLYLNSDETFKLEEEYLGRDLKSTNEGVITWSNDGSSIALNIKDEGERKYKVGENILFSLDQEGNEITGPLAENYRLIKK